jgi:propionate CoA-transferase
LTKKDIVSVMQIGSEEYLHYQPFKLDVAFVRGTTADLDGNVTMEKEALTLDSLGKYKHYM